MSLFLVGSSDMTYYIEVQDAVLSGHCYNKVHSDRARELRMECFSVVIRQVELQCIGVEVIALRNK